MAETVIGNFSAAAFFASSGAFDGFRMVARTLCPARANASAVSSPIPLLVPVMSTVAITPPRNSGACSISFEPTYLTQAGDGQGCVAELRQSEGRSRGVILGWETGIEPATSGATVRCSAS